MQCAFQLNTFKLYYRSINISGLNFVSAACGTHLLQKGINFAHLSKPIVNKEACPKFRILAHSHFLYFEWIDNRLGKPTRAQFVLDLMEKFCRELAIIRTTQQYPQTIYFQTSINECCCLKFTNHILAMSGTLITFPPVIQQNL